MNRDKLNRIAAFIAIFSGGLLIIMLTATAPSLNPKDVITWKFLAGFLFIAVGIFALKIKRQ